MRTYERFLNYVKINTKADPKSLSNPSTKCQFELAELLVKELTEIGAQNIELTDKCYVYAELAASEGCENAPALGFVAHIDTSPAFSGKNVNPIMHENYVGGDIELPQNGVIIKESDFAFMQDMRGKTLITADGTTLLGADDKAGVAEIMSLIEMAAMAKFKHGKLCVAFTPDEEVGAGADYFDVQRFGAKYAYTLDGDTVGGIEYENFNAAGAIIDITGVSVHPGSAKNVLVNALLIACEIQNALPQNEVPEKTSGYEGFFFLENFNGDSTKAQIEYIIRDHSREKFEAKKQLLQNAVAAAQAAHKTAKIELTMKDSYYNMREMIEPCMHLVENAEKAAQKCGIKPFTKAIRGGTDGSRLSFMGLPCPNLGTGGHNYHGPYELVAVEDMDKAVELMRNIVEIYADM